jgi:hypothetical protein
LKNWRINWYYLTFGFRLLFIEMFVTQYLDSDSSDKENTDIKRRKVSPWEVVQTFANKPEGEQFLKSDWVYYTKYN